VPRWDASPARASPEICAATTLRVVYPLIALLLVANVINIGADLGAMAAALRLLVDGPQLVFVAAFAIVIVLLEVVMRYSRYASVLRWLALSLGL
jgi:hypothetical protein